MNYLLNRKLFEANIKVRNWEKKELYRDVNIVIIAPLTHNALTKYAMNCQWCINDDQYEFDEYHKGSMILVIQRKPIESKIGITGRTTSEELFHFRKLLDGDANWDYTLEMIKHNFKTIEQLKTYYDKLRLDISNFRLTVTYYNIETNYIYDMGDNFMFDYHLKDIPNITPEAMSEIAEYKKETVYSETY